MRQHTVKLIVNPNADLGRAWIAAGSLRPMVEKNGGADWAGTVYPTHATELARQAGEAGYELVIAAGGDGTVHEVVNGLMQLPGEIRPRLGVVPLGSGNDFAHSVGMDHRPLHALKQIFEGKSRRVDVGHLRSADGRNEYWANTLGIGFDAAVTLRSRNFRMFRGFLIYLLAVLQTIALNHDAVGMQVSTDREHWEQRMLMLALCNGGREGGGFRVHPGAKNDDGMLEWVGIGKVSRLMMLRLLPAVMAGTHLGRRAVQSGRFTAMTVQADRPLYIHIDGEIFTGWGVDVRSIEVDLLPGALEVVA